MFQISSAGAKLYKHIRLYLKQLQLSFYQNHSDGTLTSNKANSFCFIPALSFKRLFWKYVSLENGYEPTWNKRIALRQQQMHINSFPTVIYDRDLHSLTVGGSKVVKIHNTTYSCFKRIVQAKNTIKDVQYDGRLHLFWYLMTKWRHTCTTYLKEREENVSQINIYLDLGRCFIVLYELHGDSSELSFCFFLWKKLTACLL